MASLDPRSQGLDVSAKVREGDNAILDINGDYKAFVTIRKDG